MAGSVFNDIHGKPFTIESAVPYVPPNGGSGAPVIPSNANVKMLDASTAWQGEHDSVTGGTASGSTKYLGEGKGRLFQTSFQNNAGYRWHNMFVRDTSPNHYCYKLGVAFDHPELIGCLELDVQHVAGPSQVYYCCTQATSWAGCWEYTTTPSGKCHWNQSPLKIDPRKWAANSMQQISIYTHRDNKGNAFYEGVEFNGVYSPFPAGTGGLSMLKQNWTVGDLLINFQLGGRGNGSISATALNLMVYYWQA